MIVVLNCSTSWCQNDTIPSTGVGEQADSLILVPISAIKTANSKMVELKYEKEINNNLRAIISNDSLIIDGLNTTIDNINTEHNKKIRKVKRQRNAFIGSTVGVSLLLLLLLL